MLFTDFLDKFINISAAGDNLLPKHVLFCIVGLKWDETKQTKNVFDKYSPNKLTRISSVKNKSDIICIFVQSVTSQQNRPISVRYDNGCAGSLCGKCSDGAYKHVQIKNLY